MKKITFLLFCLSTVMHLSAQSIVIGTGTDLTNGSSSDPVDAYFKSMKYQVVYTAAELSATLTPYDEITSLGFSVSEIPGSVTLTGYTIKMGHTSATNSAVHLTTANETVKNAFTYTPTATAAGSFDTITFDTNFVWNGSDNIVIEICTSGPNSFTTPYGGVRATALPAGSRTYRSDTLNACDSNTNTTNTNRPNIQFTFVDGIPPTDVLDFYNLQYPATGAIGIASMFNVYARAYEAGLTDVTAGQAPGIRAWIGYSLDNTNPNGTGWTWVEASFNVEVGNDDEYMLDLGASIPSIGTFYYASRWSLNNAPYTYGGIQADESYGGEWGVDNNISGVLTVTGPVNDDCANAIVLTVEADLSCSNPVAGTTFGSSQSLPGCIGTANDDVWYSFVATGAAHTITIANTGGSSDIVTQVFDGCGGNSIVCQDTPNSPILLAGLTAGTSYFFRIYTYSSTATITTNFTVCVGTPPAPPANDDCNNAESLVCGVSAIGTTISATGGSSTSCLGSIGNDVWYKYIGDNNTIDLTVLSTLTGGEAQVEVYSSSDSTCAGFSLTNCYESEGSGENPVVLTFDANAGTVYFIRIGNWINGSPGFNFTLDAVCTPYPTCPAPINGLVTGITSNSANLGWTEIGTATAWDIEWGLSGFTPTGNPTIDDTSDNPYSLGGLTANTAYEFYVRSDCGMDNTDTSTWSGPFAFFTGYCIPTGTSTATYIDNFTTTGGVTNIANNASGLSTDNYEDFSSALSVSLAQGESFDFNIEIVGGTVGAAVWVDWNNNLVFETSEVSYSTTSYGNGPFTGTVTVPAAIANGNYRMRVMIDWNDSNPGDDAPCSYGGNRGETEDYTVIVDSELSTGEFSLQNTLSYFPNPVINHLKLRAQSNIQNVTIYNMLGQEVLRTAPDAIEIDVNMNQLQTGAYVLKVTINDVTETIRVIKQ